MKELNGAFLEVFLIFLVKHFRKNRPDYAKFSDEQIIAKFKRRHLVDQAGVFAVFLDEQNGGNGEDLGIKHMLLDIKNSNDEFNSKQN